MSKILFICRHNCFRSRVAEEYMKIVSAPDISISSAGLIPSDLGPTQFQREVVREYGFDIPNRAKGITAKLLSEQDYIVNTANDVPNSLLIHPSYNRAELISWDISDVESGIYDKKDTKRIINSLIENCNILNRRLR